MTLMVHTEDWTGIIYFCCSGIKNIPFICVTPLYSHLFSRPSYIIAQHPIRVSFEVCYMLAVSNSMSLYFSGYRMLRQDRVQERWRRMRYYEKPYQKRNRLSYEKMKRVYDSEMERKVRFLLTKNRIPMYVYD